MAFQSKYLYDFKISIKKKLHKEHKPEGRDLKCGRAGSTVWQWMVTRLVGVITL